MRSSRQVSSRRPSIWRPELRTLVQTTVEPVGEFRPAALVPSPLLHAGRSGYDFPRTLGGGRPPVQSPELRGCAKVPLLPPPGKAGKGLGPVCGPSSKARAR
jgi:hypothetical protein